MPSQVSKYLLRRKENINYLLLFFVIYPFGAFLYACKEFGVKKYRVVILSFLTLYGLTFIPIENSDGEKYQHFFAEYARNDFSYYWKEITNTYTGLSRNPDIYAPTVLYLTSRISSNPQILFAVVALIYFFVFLKVLDVLWRMCPEDKVGLWLLYLIGCAFIFNLSAGVNGVRFALAFMVFSWSALMILITDKPRYLVFALTAGLVHFSLWFSCLFLLLFYLLRNYRLLYFFYGLLVISFVANTFFSQFLSENVGLLGESFETKLSGYTREGYVVLREEHKKTWNWYVLYNMYATYYFLIAAIIFTRIRIFRLRFSVLSEKIYVFVILLYIQSMLSGNVVDSISNRFVILAKFFGITYLLYLYAINPNNKMMRVLGIVYIPILMLTVLVSLRADSFTISPYLLLGNIFMMIFFKTDTPLTELF